MSNLMPFTDPRSVIQRSPMSGVFGCKELVNNKPEFMRRVLAHWYSNPDNTISVESRRHVQCAEELYEFYLFYLKQVEKGLAGGRAIHQLYKTGCIKTAKVSLNFIPK